MFEWRKIKGYPYSVSSEGDVRYDRTKQCLKHQKSKRGGYYPFVNLYKNGKSKNYTVHKLVAAAFIGERPRGYQIHHKDGDKTNASASNLEYLSVKEHNKKKRR